MTKRPALGPFDWVPAVGLAAVAGADVLLAADPGPRVAASLTALAMTLPVAWRRVAPIPVLIAVSAAVLVPDAGSDGTLQVSPFVGWLGYLMVAYSIGAHAGGRVEPAALWLVTIALTALEFVTDPQQAPTFAAGSVFTGGFWLAGRALRSRTELVGEHERRAAGLELEHEQQARAAVARERARMARELHDVIAHNVSVMIVQAGAAEQVLDADPGRARQPLRSVQESGRQTIDELRRLLGILRDGDERPGLLPQPSMTQLDQLAGQFRDADLPVSVSVEGERRALPPGVDLSAYRIVQEALTNTLKHAGRARAEVTVRYASRAIELEILDDGAARGNGAGSGQGLIGMRERVSLYGGSLEAGHRPGGGYAVRALLPIEREPW